jgi:hypothetical protein
MKYIRKLAFWKSIIFHIPEGILISHVGIAGYFLLFICPEINHLDRCNLLIIQQHFGAI